MRVYELIPELSARSECLMYLHEGLGTQMCDPQSYLEPGESELGAGDFLEHALVLELSQTRCCALLMLRYAHEAGFAKVHALALLMAAEQIQEAQAMADEMFAHVSPEELLAYLPSPSGMVDAGGAA